MQPARAVDPGRAAWVGAGAWFAAVIGWIHLPLLREGGLLGAPGTDVLRAAWGFDHVAQALPGVPFWTDRVGWPVGVKLLVLPMVSTLLGAPLRLLGLEAGYDAWILLLLWATAMATAWLAAEVAGTLAGGLLAGTFVVVQPMMLLALTDGTPEYVAFWAVPATLAALVRAREARDLRWPLAAAAFATVVALDSPYHVVFTAPFVPLALRGVPRRAIGVAALASAVGAALVAAAYWGLPVQVEDARRASNSVRLLVWWQWEAGKMQRPWEYTMGAGFIPVTLLLGGVALALLRPLRAAGWLGIAALGLVLALGPAEDNAQVLGAWLGKAGREAGQAVADLNAAFPVPIVRFPRRWLVPVALAVGIAAAIGLERLRPAWLRVLVAIALAGGTVAHTMQRTGYRDVLPRWSPPHPAFATFIAEHPAEGALLSLPRTRASNTAAKTRDDIPVFAGLDKGLASADHLWVQALTGRPAVYSPQGLRTMVARWKLDDEIDKLLHDLDDSANPGMTGNPVPPSATQEPARRAAAAAALVAHGLGFVAIDEAVYGEAGVALVEAAFAAVTAETAHFDDGTGVTVLVLRPGG